MGGVSEMQSINELNAALSMTPHDGSPFIEGSPIQLQRVADDAFVGPGIFELLAGFFSLDERLFGLVRGHPRARRRAVPDTMTSESQSEQARLCLIRC